MLITTSHAGSYLIEAGFLLYLSYFLVSHDFAVGSKYESNANLVRGLFIPSIIPMQQHGVVA